MFFSVIIGGSHHGTIIVPYLAKAGLTVGVFERLDHLHQHQDFGVIFAPTLLAFMATPRTYWAPKDLAFLEDKYMHEIFLLGMPSKIFCLTAPDSIWDPSRVPEGKHSLHVEEFTCPARLFSRKEWRQ